MNERIKELRKSLNLTLEKFGERLGVSKVAISKIENGVNDVSERMLKSICREFNVNEEWLRHGTLPMHNELTRSQVITDFTADILKDEEESFKKRFIEALAQLDVEDWKFLEKIVDSMTEKKD